MTVSHDYDCPVHIFSRVCAREPGVPSLPPASFGYRHFTARPVYFYHGRLFHVPPSENEHGTFDVEEDASWKTQLPEHPLGGHNYYSGRDLETMSRRMMWIEEMMAGDSNWESEYLSRVAKEERKWRKAKAHDRERDDSDADSPRTRTGTAETPS